MSGVQRVLDGLVADDRFTGALALPGLHRSVSAVLATYNRCPTDPAVAFRDNPLTWALDSLLAQVGDALAEIVVVDDGSTDHTEQVLASYTTGGATVPIRVLRLARHEGAWAARNAAVAAASAPWVLFGDDDCVYAPHYVAGAAYVLAQVRRTDSRACAVNLPFYYRRLRPSETRPAKGIGLLRPERAEFATWFHTWPDSYVSSPPLLDERSGIVAPMRVELIGGTAVVDVEALQDVGGFVDLSAWPSSYSDHLHLSADLTDNGWRLYHCPDPRLSAVHLKFGAVGRYTTAAEECGALLPALGRGLGELIDLSAQPRVDTGCRVADDDFHSDMIGTFFAFFAGRSLDGGFRWAQRMWTDFVQAGEAYSRAVATVPGLVQRRRLWRDGLARGARWLTGAAARPGRTPAEVDALLDRICVAVGDVPFNWRVPP